MSTWGGLELDASSCVVKLGTLYGIGPLNALAPQISDLKRLTTIDILACAMRGTLGALRRVSPSTPGSLMHHTHTWAQPQASHLPPSGAEPLSGCAALKSLSMSTNEIAGTLEPLASCKALELIKLSNNGAPPSCLHAASAPLIACLASLHLYTHLPHTQTRISVTHTKHSPIGLRCLRPRRHPRRHRRLPSSRDPNRRQQQYRGHARGAGKLHKPLPP